MKKNKEKLLENFKNKCKEKNFKITPQRTVIYEELISSTDHPNVETLYKRVKKIFPHISFDTVYRTLSFFYDIGVAEIIDGVCATRRYEGNTDKHYHFLCTQCNNIIDVCDCPFEYEVPQQAKDHFDIKNIRVVFEGICRDCQQKN
ncbi:MAG: Fur family transcriptional regulator [Actinomycetota bacterium]|nr:Fur family transcriptional regulator [Actinomycetota bacterium]